MGRTRTAVVGIMTSLALASVTLAVFARNQYNGPEGALRRFVTAVARSDRESALEATGGAGGATFDQLAAEVHFNLRAGGVYNFVEMRGQDSQALALVEVHYVNRNRVEPTLWALTKVGRRWYVDVEGSARLRGWPV